MQRNHISQWRVLTLFLIVLLWPNAAAASDTSLTERLRGCQAVAHEGGTFALDGNTLHQFKAAQRAGVDVIDLDLRISKDGIPVVFHDKRLNFWTWCKGKVSERTVTQLERCRYKLNPYHIPTLEEVMRWSNGEAILDLQPKDFETLSPAIRLIQKYNAYEWVYIQSKSSRTRYYAARSMDPKVNLLFAAKDREALNWVLSLNDDHLIIVEIGPEIRSEGTIARIHRAGKLVTEDVWLEDPFRELFGANCAWAYRQGIDLPVSNRPWSCVQQRDRGREGAFPWSAACCGAPQRKATRHLSVPGEALGSRLSREGSLGISDRGSSKMN